MAVVAPLPGTKGKTIEDQRNVDRVIAQSCATGLLGTQQCELHGVASEARKAELKGAAR